MEKIVLTVNGMSCEHCAKAITSAVSSVSGTSEVVVDLKKNSVSFNCDPAKTPLEAIKNAITEEGYTVV